METTTYTVEYSATNQGQRIMAVKHVDLIDGYSSFSDIPKILEANTGHKDIVIISAILKVK